MSFVRYEPYNLFDRFQSEINRLGLFESLSNELHSDDNPNFVANRWRPAVDIREEDDRFVIRADIPGVDPKDIEITMDQGVLAIKGERSSDKQEASNGYERVERASGTFTRRFALPDTADAEKIEATGKDGVLEIVLPKLEKVQPRRITVKG